MQVIGTSPNREGRSSSALFVSLQSAQPALMLLGFALLGGSMLLSSHYLPWTSFQQEIVAAAGALMLGMAALARPQPLRWPLLAWAALALASVPLAQMIGGRLLYAGDGVLASLYLLAFALAVATGRQLSLTDHDDLLDGLAITFLAVSLISTVIAASQWLGTDLPLPGIFYAELWRGQRPGANLGQPNQLGTCLFLGLVGAGWLYQRGRLRAPALAAAAVLLGFGIAATGSRTQWVTVACLVGWTFYASRRAAVAVRPVAVVAFAIGFYALAASWSLLNTALDLAPVRDLDAALAIDTRPLHWRNAIEALMQRPWLGYGWGEVMVGVSDVVNRMPAVHQMSEYAHNLALDLLLWNGIPLGGAVLVGLAWWVARHVADCREPVAAFLLAAIGGVLVHALLEFPHAYVYFLVPAGLMMGALDALSPIATSPAMPRPAHALVLAAAATAGGVVAVDYGRIELDHREMRLAYMGLEQARPPEATTRVVLLDHMRAFIVAARTPIAGGLSTEELDALERTTRRFPHPPLLLRYAAINALNGRRAEARDALQRLCQLHEPRFCRNARIEWDEMAKTQPALGPVPLP